MSKTRTIVALRLNAAISQRANALVAKLKPHAENARWVEQREDWHLPLMHMGDLTDMEVVDACKQMANATSKIDPFQLKLGGPQFYPTAEQPKGLWLSISEGAESIRQLHDHLKDELQHLLFRKETRAFVPHLTLVRLPHGKGEISEEMPSVIENLADYDGGEMPLTEVTLLASELFRNGPKYHVLARCPLG